MDILRDDHSQAKAMESTTARLLISVIEEDANDDQEVFERLCGVFRIGRRTT